MKLIQSQYHRQLIKAQSLSGGKVYYHASRRGPISKFIETGQPLYLSNDKNFGERLKGDQAVNTIVEPNLKNTAYLNYEEVERLISSHYGNFPEQTKRLADAFLMSEATIRDTVFNWLKQEGYDSAVIEDWDGGFGTIDATVVFDPTQVTTFNLGNN